MNFETAPEKGALAFIRLYSGIFSLVGSSVLWGLLPLYWKLLGDVPSLLIVYHRILWSFVFLVPITLILGGWRGVVAVLRNTRTLCVLILSGLVLALNWLQYIWAVNNGLVLETSLGYYILPLINVMVGIVFFGDKPRRAQYIAIALAFIGVATLVAMAGHVPWVALGLGVSFSIYGILRKIAPVDSLPGLFVETLVLSIPALIAIVYSSQEGFSFMDGAHFGRDILLIGTGVATTLPLLLFTYSVRRISLITVGIMQYFSPTIAFLLGVYVFQEPFSLPQKVAFGFIWGAVLLYTADSFRSHRAKRHH